MSRPSNRHEIGLPPRTHLLRIDRGDDHWRLWVHSADFVYGTYMALMDDGSMWQVTVRRDEGDDWVCVRPRDQEMESRHG